MREQIRDLKAQAQAGGLPLLQALHPEHCGQGVFNLVQHELKILHGLGKQISLLIVLRMPGDARKISRVRVHPPIAAGVEADA